jgi:xylulokinase
LTSTRRKVVYDKSLNFDRALPQYKTQNGVLPNRDPLVKHSPPLMWAEALDLIFAQMKKDGVALGEILAISGSGQQHGSVYFNDRAPALAGLNPEIPGRKSERRFLAQDLAHLDGFLDRQGMRRNPQKLGGIKATASRTGSDTFERFTGPQIRKFYKTEPEAYARPPASRSSVRSWRRCSPGKSRRLISATARG